MLRAGTSPSDHPINQVRPCTYGMMGIYLGLYVWKHRSTYTHVFQCTWKGPAGYRSVSGPHLWAAYCICVTSSHWLLKSIYRIPDGWLLGYAPEANLTLATAWVLFTKVNRPNRILQYCPSRLPVQGGKVSKWPECGSLDSYLSYHRDIKVPSMAQEMEIRHWPREIRMCEAIEIRKRSRSERD